MTVRKNIGYPLKLAGVAADEIEQRVDEAARTLQLEAVLDRKPGQLSGGQRQRVAMGRAIVRKPAVFLMDEPLSNLDAKLRVQMRAEIARLQREFDTTTMYVTHDQVEAMTMGDRVAVLNGGRIEQCDTPRRPLRPARQPVRRRVHRLAVDELLHRDHQAARRRLRGRGGCRHHPARRFVVGRRRSATGSTARSRSACAPRRSPSERDRHRTPAAGDRSGRLHRGARLGDDRAHHRRRA